MTYTTDLDLPDREILTELYKSTSAWGFDWTHSENWLSDKPLEEWYGVTVGDNRRVTRLELAGNQLRFAIPPELANLASLERLDLRDNLLSGGIPPELANLANLERLDLGNNQLSGEIPPEIANLANLERLDLENNQLSGGIPPELANLANLERLNLGTTC